MNVARFGFLLPAAGPLLILIAWECAASPNIGGVHFLPLPASTLKRAVQLSISAAFVADLFATLGRWAAGFAMAIAVGTPIGLLLGVSATFDRATSLTVDFFRSLPVTAAFPIFLVILGVGDATMIAMVFFATVFIVMMQTAYGVRSMPEARRKMAKSFGATPFQILLRIRAVEAAGHVLIAMRTVLSLSLVVAVVSEMFVGASRGIGQRLYLSYQLQSLDDLYAIVLIAGALGYGANRLFLVIERRVSL